MHCSKCCCGNTIKDSRRELWLGKEKQIKIQLLTLINTITGIYNWDDE